MHGPSPALPPSTPFVGRVGGVVTGFLGRFFSSVFAFLVRVGMPGSARAFFFLGRGGGIGAMILAFGDGVPISSGGELGQ